MLSTTAGYKQKDSVRCATQEVQSLVFNTEKLTVPQILLVLAHCVMSINVPRLVKRGYLTKLQLRERCTRHKCRD